MKFHFLTVFPEYFGVLDYGIIGRAAREGRFSVNVVNIRDYSTDKHRKTDDYPYGGGAGMVMTPDPIVRATEAADPDHKALRIYMSPKGEPFKQGIAKELAAYDELLFLCGGYEGVDERAIELTVDREISIGDYVLTGGELAACIIADSVVRLVPGAIGDEASALTDCFQDNLLAPPVYTRPAEFRGWRVPDVLLSGNFAQIEKWQDDEAWERTRRLRPDLLEE